MVSTHPANLKANFNICSGNRKKPSVKHSIEKPILPNFMNLSAIRLVQEYVHLNLWRYSIIEWVIHNYLKSWFSTFATKSSFTARILVTKPKIPWRHLFAKRFLSDHVLFAKTISQNYPNDHHVYHTYI